MGYSITDFILEKVPKDFWQKEHFIKAWGEWAKPIPNWEGETFSLKPEHAGAEGFKMFNTGGVEVEVGEFLYALTRIVRPTRILETGTHLGISDLYFALALKANGHGHLTTVEFNPPFYLMAQALFEHLELDDCIKLVRSRVERWDPGDMKFDIVLLDTEPGTRFDELVKFYDNVEYGGYILIHDLGPNLGVSKVDYENPEFGSFGDFREKFGDLLRSHKLQTVSFPSPRGLMMFQKLPPGASHYAYLKGDL